MLGSGGGSFSLRIRGSGRFSGTAAAVASRAGFCGGGIGRRRSRGRGGRRGGLHLEHLLRAGHALAEVEALGHGEEMGKGDTSTPTLLVRPAVLWAPGLRRRLRRCRRVDPAASVLRVAARWRRGPGTIVSATRRTLIPAEGDRGEPQEDTLTRNNADTR